MHDNAPQPSENSPATIDSAAASAAGHFAVWQLIGAACSLLASVAAFNEDARSALFFGLSGLTAAALAFMCRRLRASGRTWANDRLLWFAGAAAWMLAMAVTAGACLHVEAGLGILGFVRIGRGPLQMLAMVIAAGFATLALMTMAFGERGQRTRWLAKRMSVAWVLAVLVFGPQIPLRDNASRWTLTREAITDALAQPWAKRVTLTRVATGQIDENGAEIAISCPAWRSDRWLLLRFDRHLAPDTYDEALLATWRTSCADEGEEALANGVAAESALLRGDVATFLSNTDGLRLTDVIGLPLDRFEPALRQRLSDRIPPSRQSGMTLFDLILLEGTDQQVKRSLPGEEGIHPHHRYALYARGLAGLAAHMPRMTAESYADEQVGSASVYAQLGIVNPLAFASVLGPPNVPYTGGYTDHDFHLANRHCDAGYAEFLAQKGLEPTIEHARQLLEALILARFDSHSSQNIDTLIPTTVGLPAGKTIEHCLSLARWYGKMIPPRHPQDIERIILAVGEARMAAIYWRDRGLPTSAEPPTLAADAAVEMLMHTPPSAAAYCSWVNAAFWELVDPREQVPETTPALLRLQGHWSKQPWEDIAVTRFDEHQAETVPAQCPLTQSGFSGDLPSTLAALDRSLKALDIPCHAGPKDDIGFPTLACRSR
jgi:hypothetical protein